MKNWNVTVPVAGHAYVEVQAETEQEAIEKAIGEVEKEHVETWEPLEQFNRGNVCYCPHPWEATATDEGEVDA